MDFICSTLFAFTIVGAYEVAPGWMQVNQLNPYNNEIITLGVATDDYLSCWENGVPVQRYGPAYWRGASTASYPWLSIYMDKEDKRRRITQEIEDTFFAYHMMPHMAMVPDYFLRYWDLAEAVCDYFDIPFRKPTLTKPEEFEALKGTIDKTE